MKNIILIMVVSFLLSACASNYYDKFGGYPIESQEYVIEQGNALIKLLVTYRYPLQGAEEDTTTLNITIKTIVDNKDMEVLFIDRLSLVAADSSYLFSYPSPAIYDTNGKYPIRFNTTDPYTGELLTSSDQPTVFTVDRMIPEYRIILYYRYKRDDGSYDNLEEVIPITAPKIKRKTQTVIENY